MSFTNHFTQFDDMIAKINQEHGITLVDGMVKPSSPDSSLIADQEIGMLTKIDANETRLSEISVMLKREDVVSKTIEQSHLLVKSDDGVKDQKSDKNSMRRLKARHLGQLRRMITEESSGFESGEVRGSDVPIEYVAVLAFIFIGVAGVVVMM